MLPGFYSGGPAWLFGVAEMAGCLQGIHSAVAALVLNAASIAGIGALLFWHSWIAGPERLPGSLEITMVAGFNLMLLDTA